MLTDLQCRRAAPRETDYKLSDEKNLYLFVTKRGAKIWRMKYRIGGKERRLIFGPYPEVTLPEARAKRDAARKLLRDGLDPGTKVVVPAASPTLKIVAVRWMALQADVWKLKHAQDVRHSFEKEVFPALGETPIAEIAPADIRKLLTTMQARGATEGAHRIRARLSQVFKLAIASDEAEFDPATSLSAVLKPIVKRKHPALLDIAKARECMLTVEREPGFPMVKLASRLLALTAARPGMIRFAELKDFEDLDSDKPLWRVPAAKMKLERAHSEQAAFDFVVPLSRQAVATITAAAVFAGNRKYLFPSLTYSHQPISENALSVAYRRAGYNRIHVPHGWRSSFSTIMNERATELGNAGDRAVLDLMLAHAPRGTEAHYNRAAYMGRRRELMQQWADLLLDGVPSPDTLLVGPRR